MKSIRIVLAFACLGVSAAYAQKIHEDKVPANVLSNFKKQFTTTKSQWEMDETDFEVNFKINGTEYSAKYDQLGNWLETEQEIKKSELPVSINQSIEKEFPKTEVEEVEKVSYPNHKTVYELEIKNREQKFEVQYSAEGQLLKKEEIQKKD